MHTLRMLLALLALSATGLFSVPAWAEEEEDEDDILREILGEVDEDSVEAEVEAVKTGNIGDTVGARQEDIILLEDENQRRRVIKTIQSKNFLKLHRWELSPHIAFVANDPFLNRYIAGTGLGYHITEIFEIEASFDFSPDLGETDWKPLTKQLYDLNHVTPDLSKLTYFASATFAFSPIYGKVALTGRKIINFDIFGAFGMGLTRTADDLELLQADISDPNDPAFTTEHQTHPTTNFGGGVRIILDENIATRIEGRSLVYIETVNGTTLEMKNNFILQGSVSFFIPNMRR